MGGRLNFDLPNYIDSGRVEFDIVGESLCVKAAMKGCGIRPPANVNLSVSNAKSSSTLDLTRLGGLRRKEDSSTRRRKSANDVIQAVRDAIRL